MSMMCPCSNLKSLQIIAQIKEVKALNRRIKGLNPSRFQRMAFDTPASGYTRCTSW